MYLFFSLFPFFLLLLLSPSVLFLERPTERQHARCANQGCHGDRQQVVEEAVSHVRCSHPPYRAMTLSTLDNSHKQGPWSPHKNNIYLQVQGPLIASLEVHPTLTKTNPKWHLPPEQNPCCFVYDYISICKINKNITLAYCSLFSFCPSPVLSMLIIIFVLIIL